MSGQSLAPPSEKRFRIGSLSVSTRSRFVVDGSEVLALPPKAVDVLLVLLDRAGELVSKDELKRAVWNDLAVDEGNLSKNIYVLRIALRERLGEQEVIKTHSRRGYQYVGPVEAEEVYLVSEPETEAGISELAVVPTPSGVGNLVGFPHTALPPVAHSRRSLIWLAGILSVIAAVALTGLWVQHRHAVEEASAPVSHPADLVEDWRPVTHLEPEDQLGAQAISPTGAFVAYREKSGTYLRQTNGGGAKRLNVPAGLAVDSLSWFPDESRLLVSGEQGPTTGESAPVGSGSGGGREAWIVPVGAGNAGPVLQDAALAAVSPDGKRIAYARANKSELWVADADGQNDHRLRNASSGDSILCILWSPASDRIVIDREHVDSQVQTDGSKGALGQLQQQHEYIYQSYRTADGKLTASKTGLHFESGALLPDGRLLYPATGPTGVTRVAAVFTTLETGSILLAVDKFAEELGQQTYGVSNLSASRDGKLVSLTMDRDAINVYAGSLQDSAEGLTLADVRRMTYHAGTSYPTGWDPAGKSLLFDEGDGEHSVIAETGPGEAIKVIADTGGRAVQGHFTPDGRWILFLHYGGKPVRVQSIDRVSATGGADTPLITADGLEDFHCSSSSVGRCVFRVRRDDREYVYVTFTAENGALKEVAHKPIGTSVLGDWSLSPDGLTIATSDHNPDKPAVQLIALPAFGQGASSPGGSASATVSSVIPVPGYGTILGASWDAKGTGFFVSAHSNAGYALLHIDMAGTTTLLKKSVWPIWGVPSWDGKKLAFPAATSGNTNVWIGRLN